MPVTLTVAEITAFCESAHWLANEFEFIAATMAQSTKDKRRKLYTAIERTRDMAEKLSLTTVTVRG